MLVSYGSNVKSNELTTKEVEWPHIVDAHQIHPVSMHDFAALSDKERMGIKCTFPYFVGCGFNEPFRKKEHAYGRKLLTLDADHGKPEGILYDHILYSTHSHSPDNPRFRLILPLSRTVNPHEYKVISMAVMKEIGIDVFEIPSSIDYARAMFVPSCPFDAHPIFETEEGFQGEIDVDELLGDDEPILNDTMMQLPDPRSKPGIIGEFCSVYNVAQAIEAFLGDVYQKDGERYTYRGAGTSKGGRIHDGGHYFYSSHESDPANDGHCKNAYDLVCLHNGEIPDDLPLLAAFRQSQFDKIEAVDDIKKKDESGMLDAPGILGEMISDILPHMDRTVPEYAIGAALHSLSMVSSQSYCSFSRGSKLNMMTITIGESASGKDVPQRYVSNAAKLCGQPDWPDFTSHQEITKNLFRGKGQAFYVVDECQKMFLSAEKATESYLSGLGDEIMKLFTAEKPHRFRGNDTASMTEELTKKKKQLEAPKSGDLSEVNQDEIDAQLAEIDEQLDMLKNGIKKPNLSFYASTTPVSFHAFMTEKALQSGSFSRVCWIIPDLAGNVPPLNDVGHYECKGEFSPSITAKLKAVIDQDGREWVRVSPEAVETKKSIMAEIDSNKYRNHRFGEVYRRAWEKVSKIASVMGAGDGGIVNAHHLEWAFKFVMADIDAVTRHHREAELGDKSEKKEVYELFKCRIMEIMQRHNGSVKKGRLKLDVLKKKQYRIEGKFDGVLASLIKKGKLDESNQSDITLPQ